MKQLQRDDTIDSWRDRFLDLCYLNVGVYNFFSAGTRLPLFSINVSPDFHLGTSAGCLKLGPMKLSLGWWLMGLVPPLKTLEGSIGMVHPGDGTGGMFFPTAPWKALGSLNPSMQVGLISAPKCCWK